MEESKRKEIRDYIESQVNPVIRPLVEEIVRKRPSNIAGFINEYSFRLMSKSYSIKITKMKRDSIPIQMKIAKKLRLSFCADWKNAKKRKLIKRIVAKASVRKSLDNSMSRWNFSPR